MKKDTISKEVASGIQYFLTIRIQKDEEALGELSILLGFPSRVALRIIAPLLELVSLDASAFWENALPILEKSFLRPLSPEERNKELPIKAGKSFYTDVIGLSGRIAGILCRADIEPGMLIPLSREELEQVITRRWIGVTYKNEVVTKIIQYKKLISDKYNI